MPQDFAGRWHGKTRKHPQKCGLPGTGWPQKGDDHARLYRHAGRRDNLNLFTAGALETFFDSSRLDDRLYRRGNPTLVFQACDGVLFRQFVCDLLPCCFGQLVEKHRALNWIHLRHNSAHVVSGQGVQQDERVVVWKDRCQLSGKLHRQTSKEDLLLFIRQTHERVCGHGRVKLLHDRNRAIKTPLRQNCLQFFVSRPLHRVHQTIYLTTPRMYFSGMCPTSTLVPAICKVTWGPRLQARLSRVQIHRGARRDGEAVWSGAVSGRR